MNDTIYPVAILAGGMATRMHPLTERIPKSLLEVNGEPFIAHQLRLLASQGTTRVVVCAAHLGEMIEDYVGNGKQYGLEVDYSYDGDHLLGTAGALKRSLPKLSEKFFVMYGDSYLPCRFRIVQNSFKCEGKLALMTVFRNEDRFDSSNVVFENGKILVYDKSTPNPKKNYIDYGLGIFDRKALENITDDEPAGLTDLYQMMLTRNELAAHEITERFYEIGSIQGLEQTCQYLKTKAADLKRPA